jgi:hypothetical protein
MTQTLTKEDVIAVLLTTFHEVQESCDGDEQVLSTSKPGADFEYIDSQILLQVTGLIAEELGIEIPKKCQLFLGKNGEQLTVEEAAEKILSLNPSDGSR